MNGKQGGDPAKLAAALIEIAGRDTVPLRWPAGALDTFETKAHSLIDDANANRALSGQLGHDDA